MAKKDSIKVKLDMFQKETFQYERLEDVLGDRFGRYSKAIIQERDSLSLSGFLIRECVDSL